jgi:hypothetical protein
MEPDTMDISAMVNTQLHAQNAKLQMAMMRQAQETEGSDKAVKTLANAAIKSQAAFAASAAQAVGSVNLIA